MGTKTHGVQFSDNDNDGCRDASEDSDDDDDGVLDSDDDCPLTSGLSVSGPLIGCPDADTDGWADQVDSFPQEATQWNDSDGDGWGDNWDNSTWNESRDPAGEWITGAFGADRCPHLATDLGVGTDGCPEDSPLQDPLIPSNNLTDERSFLVKAIIGGFLVLMILTLGFSILIQRTLPRPASEEE